MRLIGADDGADRSGADAALQLPVTLETTFAGFWGPCETVWVVRVQVPFWLLNDTMVVLVMPVGALPKDATLGKAPIAAGCRDIC